MYKSQYLNNDLINLCKVPAPIKIGLIRQFDNWFECNGIDWTIDRIKSIKLACIRFYSDLNLSLSWFRLDHKGFPKGYVGSILRYSKLSPHHLKVSLQLLNCYTSFIKSKETPNQVKKFISGVNAEPSDIDEHLSTLLEISCDLVIGKRYIPQQQRSIIMRPFSPNKREPHASGKTYPEGKYPLECLTSYVKQTLVGARLVSNYRPLFKGVLDGISFIDHRDVDYASTVVCEYTNHVGRISFIQEPGNKLRAVANPARVYQEVLKPLGDSVYKILSTLPWDCTHEQSLPFTIIQEYLDKGHMCFSVDLTGATDYFPLSLQLTVLKKIFPYQLDPIHLFEDISRSPWMLPNGDIIKWKRGQPLGLYPSFGCFALTHGLLLYTLNRNKHDNAFFVLGDDVIILDEELHSNYRKVLTHLGCPVSESKSIQSRHLAEFGGKVILPTMVISNPKWRKPNEDNFIDLISNFGPGFAKTLPVNLRLAAAKIWEIPEFLGGLGFNPRGLSLRNRILLYYRDKQENQGYKLSYDRWFNHLNYNGTPSEYSFRSTTVNQKVSDDQSLISYFNKHLPNLINWWDVSGKNLYSVQPDLPIRIDLTDRKSVV